MRTYRPAQAGICLALILALLLSLTLALTGCDYSSSHETGDTQDTSSGTDITDDAHISIDFGLTKEEITADTDMAAWLESCSAVGRTIFDFYVLADCDEASGTYSYLIYFEVPTGEVQVHAKIRENDRGFIFPEAYYTTDTTKPCEYNLTRIVFKDCAREPQTLTIFLDGEQIDPLITWR